MKEVELKDGDERWAVAFQTELVLTFVWLLVCFCLHTGLLSATDGWAAGPRSSTFFQMSPTTIWGDERSRKTQVCVSPHKGLVFLSWGWGANGSRELWLFHFLTVLYRNVTQITDRQNSLYPDAKTRLWSARCRIQRHETGQNQSLLQISVWRIEIISTANVGCTNINKQVTS